MTVQFVPAKYVEIAAQDKDLIVFSYPVRIPTQLCERKNEIEIMLESLLSDCPNKEET